MKRHLLGFLSVLPLIAALTLGPASAASAVLPEGCTADNDETAPVIRSVRATSAVQYASGTSKVTVTIRAYDPDAAMTCHDAGGQPFSADGSSGLSGFWLEAEAENPFGWTCDEIETFTRISGTIYDGVWRGVLYVDKFYAPGPWVADVMAWDRGGNRVDVAEAARFNLRHNSALSANATPEPVDRGDDLKVRGYLRLLDRYDGYVNPGPGVPIRIYFRPRNGTTWTYKGSDSTNANGFYTKTFRASRDGTWQARFSGDAFFRHKWTSDYVDVR